MNLRLPSFIIIAFLLSANQCFAEGENLNIYRNDKNFNRIDISGSTSVIHQGKEIQIVNEKENLSVPIDFIDSCVFRTSSIPTLSFKFVDYPDANTLWDKDLYLNTVLDIQGNGFCESESGLTLSVKGRGNSTWSMPKKPMRLKFEKKTSICDFKKAKSYVLLANYLDYTSLKTAICLWLADKLQVPFTNHLVPCNVEINGVPQGLYNLTEKIGINSQSVDINEEEGVLFEIDTYYDEKYQFKSAGYNLPVMVHDPDFDELSDGLTPEERLKLWQEDFEKAEQNVLDGNGFESFDIDSFARYILLSEITNNIELNHPKSLFIFKEKIGDDNKYIFGPVWDFDMALRGIYADGTYYAYTMSLSLHPFLRKLRNTSGFTDKYKELYNWFLENIYDDLMNYIDEFAYLIEPDAIVNGVLWPTEGQLNGWSYHKDTFDHKQNVKDLKTWLQNRINYFARLYKLI